MPDKFKHVWWLYDKAAKVARTQGKAGRPLVRDIQRVAHNELRFTIRRKL